MYDDNDLLVEVTSSSFKPDEFIVRVSGVTTDAVETALFNIVEAGSAPAAASKAHTAAPTITNVNATPTETPTVVATTVPPTPEPTKKSPGFGTLVALAGLGAVAFLVTRRN